MSTEEVATGGGGDAENNVDASATNGDVKQEQVEAPAEPRRRASGRRASIEAKKKTKEMAETKSPPKNKKTARPEDDDSDDEPITSVTKKRKVTKRSVEKEQAESDSDDDAPIGKAAKKKSTAQKVKKEQVESDSDDDAPIGKSKAGKKKAVRKRKESDDDSDDEPIGNAKKKAKTTKKSAKGKAKPKPKAPKKKKKEEPEEPIHRWWEEEELPDGQKWKSLEHKGPLFPPPYTPLPKHVQLRYDGAPVALEAAAEEVAGFYAAMLKSDYTKKPQFNKNFFKCWQGKMTTGEKRLIRDLKKCDFLQMQAYFEAQSEKRKAASKEEKAARKEREEKIKEEYGFALVDGRKQKVGNFRVEPPGLFRGRGDHPKMGMLKYRLRPEDVIINVGDPSKAPPPPEGHRWKEVRTDNTVTWLAAWVENIKNENKYIMLNPESYLKARNDYKKYETARNLKKSVGKIREDYTKGLKDKITQHRQRATALYFIDKLALRAGGEKDTDEEADTVGCCNLRVEHVYLEEDNQVRFDFLGKDSIRYENTVKVSPQVHKNIEIFKRNKEEGDPLFDRLNVPVLNRYLASLMPGLTAKVFRTYNASYTLQEQLKATPVDGDVNEKFLAYQRANRQVAILCNHQRSAPKGFDAQVEKMDQVLTDYKKQLQTFKKELKSLKSDAKGNEKKINQLRKRIETVKGRIHKKEIAKVDKEENKTIALGTSKLNYLDPRITIAWTLKHDVPIEKVYNKTQRAKFRWASEMTTADFVF